VAEPQFAVLSRADNQLIGYCGSFHQEVDGTNEIEIGYRLHPNYWNKGLATEAAQAVRDHAFRDLNLPRVISLIHPENAASRRGGKNVDATRAQNRFQRIPSAGFRD
jgi:ribosomal-protein-alanine N-acetyltransferase